MATAYFKENARYGNSHIGFLTKRKVILMSNSEKVAILALIILLWLMTLLNTFLSDREDEKIKKEIKQEIKDLRNEFIMRSKS